MELGRDNFFLIEKEQMDIRKALKYFLHKEQNI